MGAAWQAASGDKNNGYKTLKAKNGLSLNYYLGNWKWANVCDIELQFTALTHMNYFVPLSFISVPTYSITFTTQHATCKYLA